MFKIFSIGRGTTLEQKILMLMASGEEYIPKFEKEVETIKFCNEMKIFYVNNVEEFNLLFIINGFKKGIPLESCFSEKGVKEITLDQLKYIVSNSCLIRSAPTKIFQHLSYRLELKLSNYRLWKVTFIN